MVNLFAGLTGEENTALFRKLDRAGGACDRLASTLLGTGEFASCVAAWVELNGLLSDLNDVRPAGAPPVYDSRHRPVLPAPAPVTVPTGTGWPVAK